MPSFGKKNSSGSSLLRRRTAESREFGRDVSSFHLIIWVHPKSGCIFACVLELFLALGVVLDVIQVLCFGWLLLVLL